MFKSRLHTNQIHTNHEETPTPTISLSPLTEKNALRWSGRSAAGGFKRQKHASRSWKEPRRSRIYSHQESAGLFSQIVRFVWGLFDFWSTWKKGCWLASQWTLGQFICGDKRLRTKGRKGNKTNATSASVWPGHIVVSLFHQGFCVFSFEVQFENRPNQLKWNML